MTIEWCRGDMFASGAEALVCAANAQGRLGAGQALEVRRRFPEQAGAFSAECRAGSIRPGSLFWCTEAPDPRILFVAAKGDPRQPSRIEWVTMAAEQVRMLSIDAKLRTVAMPALGCGLGGLSWTDVRPILERELAAAPGVRWLVYEPGHVVRMQIAEAIAKRITWPNRIRANAWSSGPPWHRIRVFLASELEGRNGGKRHTGVRLGWIEVDEQLRLSAHGAHAWLEDAEAAKAEVLVNK